MKHSKVKLTMLALAAAAVGPTCLATEWPVDQYTVAVGDFDGDRRDDVLYIAIDSAGTSGISRSDGATHSIVHQTWQTGHLGLPWHDKQFVPVVADFNGDRRSDVLLQASSPGNSYLILADVQGKLTAISQTLPYDYLGYKWAATDHQLIAGDFDGDGRFDLFLQGARRDISNAVFLSPPGGLFTDAAIQVWSDSYMGFRWSKPSANVVAGRIDGDSKWDLLIQAKPDIVLIDYEIPIPVPVYRLQSFGIAKARTSAECGASTPIFCDPALQRWNRDHLGADWSGALFIVVLGAFSGDANADILLQSRSSAHPNQLFIASESGQFVTGNALSVNDPAAQWTANSVRLSVMNVNGTGASELYLQATTSAGTSSVQSPTGAIVNEVSTGETEAFTYDANGRLRKVQTTGGVNAGVIKIYDLDGADNRTSQQTSGSGNPAP